MGCWYRIIIYIISFYCRIFYRHRVYGREHYYKGGAIIAANHVSFLDPPLVAISCPEEIHFLARKSLFTPFFGFLLRTLNTYPVKKGESNIVVMKKIYYMVEKGKKVLLFPEGTRSRDNQLREIQPGIGLLLSKTQGVLLPVYVHGTFSIWSVYRKFPKLFGKTACIFGSPIFWKDYADMEQKEAQELIRQQLIRSFRDLKNWYESGAEGTPP